LLRRIASRVAGGLFGVEKAPAHVARERLRRCRSCPYLLDRHVCRWMACGCDMREKVRYTAVRSWAGESAVRCPRGEW